jgi:hypothetical protein
MLQVLPATGFPRIQFWSVSRQGRNLDLSARWAGQKILHGSPTMNRRSVPNHQELSPDSTQQMLQEDNAVRTRQRFRMNQRVQFPFRREPSHYRQMIAAQPFVDHGRVPLGAIRPNHSRQQIEARFVHENQGSALPGRLVSQLRPRYRSPQSDRCLVALRRVHTAVLYSNSATTIAWTPRLGTVTQFPCRVSVN